MKSLEELKLALKSGEYDGVDITQSWLTMVVRQQQEIIELTYTLNELFECAKLVHTWYDLDTGLAYRLSNALKGADTLLEGN